jgi:hypothetical protein
MKERMMIGPFLSMDVLCGIVDGSECWHNLRPGEEIRGKWRMPDGKVGERSIVMFGDLKVIAPACVN